MATKTEILAKAKELITSHPTSGKNRINVMLKSEFGVGLRSATILKLKAEVATEQPALYPMLYAAGSVPKVLNEVYKGWIRSGFLAFEARELTLGHGSRYRAFDAKAVYDSIPGQKARETRSNMVHEQLRMGWTKQQIRQNIIDFYLKSKKVDPWAHIRAEYKPKKRVDFRDYKTRARIRARSKQKRLSRKTPVATTPAEWIGQLRERMNKTTSLEERDRMRRQIINLGGTP
jgi:hypothetical protein